MGQTRRIKSLRINILSATLHDPTKQPCYEENGNLCLLEVVLWERQENHWRYLVEQWLTSCTWTGGKWCAELRRSNHHSARVHQPKSGHVWWGEAAQNYTGSGSGPKPCRTRLTDPGKDVYGSKKRHVETSKKKTVIRLLKVLVGKRNKKSRDEGTNHKIGEDNSTDIELNPTLFENSFLTRNEQSWPDNPVTDPKCSSMSTTLCALDAFH